MKVRTTQTVGNCARCGMDHPDLCFESLERPMEWSTGDLSIMFRWWAPCPKNGDPILMAEVADEDAERMLRKEDDRRDKAWIASLGRTGGRRVTDDPKTPAVDSGNDG